MPSVICAGLITVDLVFEVAEHPTMGAKYRAKTSRMIVGGGAFIAAASVARLGGAASIAGATGDDDSGRFIRRELLRLGIEDDHVSTIPKISTACSAVLVMPDGERTIVNHRDDQLFSGGLSISSHFPFDAALADTRWPQGAYEFLRAARKAGKPAVIDAEAPVALAEDALHQASHVAFSEQGLTDFTGSCGTQALISAARRLSAWVCVTRGPDPVLCCDGHELAEVPTFRTTALDTLGAGDVWHGAFTLGLAAGLTELSAVRRANAAASLKASGACGDLVAPTACEVESLLSNAL